MTAKRSGYIEWDEFFMGSALLAAKRSKDPETQVGACIVNENNQIIGVGYNSFPFKCSDDKYPWTSSKDTEKKESKDMFVVHAEVNAIIGKSLAETKGCTLYVTFFPCNECAKVIIQSHTREIFFLKYLNEGGKKTRSSKRMLDDAGIKYTKFIKKCGPFTIDFGTNDSQSNINENSPTPSKKMKHNES